MRRFITVRSFLPALASAPPFHAGRRTPDHGSPDSAAGRLSGGKTGSGQADLSVLSTAWQRLIITSEGIG